MLASFLCCLGRVPPAYDEPKTATYTQRPAITKDVDSESRTSKNSQSSIEQTEGKFYSLRDDKNCSSTENSSDEQSRNDGEAGARESIVGAKRVSLSSSQENPDDLQKGNQGYQKLHSRHGALRAKNDRGETESFDKDSDSASEVASVSSCMTDSQPFSGDTNSCSNLTKPKAKRRLPKPNSILRVTRRTSELPAVLPTRFQFRRSSSFSQIEQEKTNSLEVVSNQNNEVEPTEIKTNKNISKLFPKRSNSNASVSKLPVKVNDTSSEKKHKHFKFLPNIKDTLKTLRRGKGGKVQSLSSGEEDNSSTTHSLKSGSFESIHNSYGNQFSQNKTGSQTVSATELTRDNSSKRKRLLPKTPGPKIPVPKTPEPKTPEPKTPEPKTSENESIKDTDSGITSGFTTRTNTPEYRSNQTFRSQTDQTFRSQTDQTSIPTIAVTNIGSESFKEEDDDLDELFTNRLPNQLLGSRSSLADSRESIYSVYSDAGEVNYGRIPVTGEIMFSIDYNHKGSTLEVHVKQCRDLAPVDVKHSRSDPYVKTYLLPDKSRSSKRKTRIKKHTLNPVFDEVVKYQINISELESRSLWLTVWHNDRFGRNDFLGEVTIPLDCYRFDQNALIWYTLQERTVTQEPELFYKGDLFIALKYIPADMVEIVPKKKSSSFRRKGKEKEAPEKMLGEVHVLVREAKNLTAMRASSGSNPFCKGYILPDVSHSTKQKTQIIKKTTNPVWQHILVFEGIDQSLLYEYGLELTVWDHEKLSSNDFLGGVRLNLGQGFYQGKPVDWMDARGEEIESWQTMIDHPNEWVDAELPLRASMGKQNVKN